MDADLAATVVPYVVAAAGAYGAAVLQRVRDTAADATAEATVGVGRRLLRRLLDRGDPEGGIEAAVEDVAANPDDADQVAALRVQLRKVFAADPGLAGEVRELLPANPVTASGVRSVAVQRNTGIVQTGDGSTAAQTRG